MDREAHLKARTAEKDDAMAAIAYALSVLEAQQRNPDHWERLCLVRAFQGIFSGCYGLALTEARLAGIPPEQHVPSNQLPTDAITSRADLPFMFKIAKAALAEPVRQFPHFGPVEIV